MSTAQPTTSIVVVLTRTFWLMFGPLFLFIIGAQIALHGRGWSTRFDLMFLVLLLFVIAARWLEFQLTDPRTATGETASQSTLIRYSVVTLGLGVTAWVVANMLGNYWLNP